MQNFASLRPQKCGDFSHAKAQRRKGWGVLCFLVMMGWVLCGVGVGQEPVEMTVSPRWLTTDDALVVTLTVNGQIVDLPQLPSLEKFELLSQQQINHRNSVNGTVSESIRFVYMLKPLESGDLTIGSFVLEVDGVRVETEPQTVQVDECSIISSIDGIVPDGVNVEREDYFYFVTNVDNDKPWLGEEIVYTFWLFVAADVPQIKYSYLTFPQFEGFWKSELDESPFNQHQCYWVVLGDRPHRISQYDWHIYPAEQGEQIVTAPLLDVVWEPSFLFALGEPIQVFGEAVVVDVQPLPDGAPEEFTGAVGEYAVERTIDKNVMGMSEDVTVDVVVRGRGNVEALPEPVWPDLAVWRVIDGEMSTAVALTDGAVRGERSWIQTLIPTEPGQWEIPALTYSYFNPETARYERTTAESVMVDVTGEAMRDEMAAVVAEDQSEIRPNRGVPDLLERPEPLLQERWSYWALWLVPLAIVLGAEVVLGLRKRPKKVRLVNVFESQSERLDGALYERFGVQFGGMTHVERRETLDELGVDNGLIEQIDAFYRENEKMRFIGADEIDARGMIDLVGGGG